MAVEGSGARTPGRHMANNEHISIVKKGVGSWNKWRGENPDFLPDLSGADLSEEDLRGANFDKAVLCGANLRRADLRNARLSEADLRNAYLRGANLREANLSKANLSLANLTDANLNEAKLDLAKLWGAQTSGWSIKGVICEWAYWDREAKRQTRYALGEFERLHAEKPTITMCYEGGIAPIEMITLPDITAKLESRHPDCVLRLKSIIEGLDHATVEIAVDKSGDVDLKQLKLDWKRMQVSQRQILGILNAPAYVADETGATRRNSIVENALKIGSISSDIADIRQKIEQLQMSGVAADDRIDQLAKEIIALPSSDRKAILASLLTTVATAPRTTHLLQAIKRLAIG
jgi:uncharacterized protein YjbI with pentapeptide repeats